MDHNLKLYRSTDRHHLNFHVLLATLQQERKEQNAAENGGGES